MLHGIFWTLRMGQNTSSNTIPCNNFCFSWIFTKQWVFITSQLFDREYTHQIAMQRNKPALLIEFEENSRILLYITPFHALYWKTRATHAMHMLCEDAHFYVCDGRIHSLSKRCLSSYFIRKMTIVWFFHYKIEPFLDKVTFVHAKRSKRKNSTISHCNNKYQIQSRSATNIITKM